jgi:hypothetical protein
VLNLRKAFGGGRGPQRPGKAPDRGKPGRVSGASKILAAKLLRAQGRTIPWRNAAIYALVVVAVFGAVAAWDYAYEAHRTAVLNPPPQIAAKALVESIIGQGSVHNVSADKKAGTLDVTVEDVLTKPTQSHTEMQKDLTNEGGLVIQVLQSRLPSFKTITIHLVKSGAPLATVRLEPGKKTPTADFASGVR